MTGLPPCPGQPLAWQLSPTDNVAVLGVDVRVGQTVAGPGFSVMAQQEIPSGHKIALANVARGARVIKYGQSIGVALQPIRAGDHVHTHNLGLPERPPVSSVILEPPSLVSIAGEAPRCFQGYSRPDGRAGTRNYLAVIASVNCASSVARRIADPFRGPEFTRDFPGVDGVMAVTHTSGCGIAPGEPLQLLRRVLAGMVRHPNISGCVLIGLGCENNQVSDLVRESGLNSMAHPPAGLIIQELGGVSRTVNAGVAAVRKLLSYASDQRRSPQPVSQLALALKCGGSDAWSGLTANPALGMAVDELVRRGGTAVLAETPEIYGAEHLLANRAATPQVREQLLARIRWWENHVHQFGASLDQNPSAGNKAGGLTTIYEKSLGAVAKGGRSPLRAVYQYAEPVREPGLGFMDTPGYDPVSMTGLVAGGCNLGVFTTGRGSVYGCQPMPCLKVASHTALFARMPEDMDLNAGTILEGTESLEQVGTRLFEQILRTASGQKTRSELAGIGEEEFVPWMLGPTL